MRRWARNTTFGLLTNDVGLDLSFIGHDVVSTIEYLLTFRSTLMPLFSGFKSLGNYFPMDMSSYSGRPGFSYYEYLL